MNYNKAGTAVACAAAVLFSSSSFAQLADKPGFYSALSVSYTSDDNIFRQATTKTSDGILALAPELLFIKGFGKHKFSAEYIGDYASYGENTTENYDDHFVNFDLLFDLTKKLNIDLQANYSQGHESRGSSGASNTATVANKLTDSRVFAGFAYGRKTAKAQVEMDVAVANTKFTNNNQSFRDRKTTTISTRVFYNLGGKTSIFAELKQNTLDYLNPGTRNRDSSESFYHVGARWGGSNKTSGTLKVGSFDKKFDSATETNGTGTSYDANVEWKPKKHSSITLGLSSSPQEATTTDSFYTTSLVSIGWKHDVNSKLALNVNYSDGTDEYSGTRTDKISNASLGINYKFRRWIDVGLEYTNSIRDSTDNSADYTDNLIMLKATFSKL